MLKHVEASQVLNILSNNYQISKKQGRRGQKATTYAEVICTFDIETTSMIVNDRKVAFMYIWQMYYNGHIIVGRTWDEFFIVIDTLARFYAPHILPIYVHNLGFEFSFMQHLFLWDEVFCTGPRTPVRAKTDNIEFRDSLALSGLPLSKLPTKTKKLVGDLDYSLVRHADTPLTDKEYEYCYNDVIVLAEYIEDKLKDNGDTMATVPMTRTGYVRRDVRQTMIKANEQPKHLTMTPDQYRKLRKVYAGGFTHANAAAVGRVFHKVESLDLTSSYPTVMVAEYYPISTFREVYPKDAVELRQYLDNYACMFKLTITDCNERDDVFEHIISESKCEVLSPDAVIDNGRVVSASYLEIYCNEIDLQDFTAYYKGDFTISELEVAHKGRLPKSLVESVLKYYSQKTTLKGVAGEEVMYAKYKEFVNSVYGMCVTDPVKPLITYMNEWIESEPDVDESIKKHNKSLNRFLFYAWGVWVTSYARHNLFYMMRQIGADYLYSDTDSLKILNYQNHKDKFFVYNDFIIQKLIDACNDLGIDPALVQPLNNKGEAKPLGVWDDEATYDSFKTLGAKRYLVQIGDDITPTVAGAPKKSLAKYLSSMDDPFGAFNNQLVVPADKSGKNICQYMDDTFEGDVTDYMGNTYHVKSLSGTYIAPTTVSINMSEKYLLYLAKFGPNYLDIQI